MCQYMVVVRYGKRETTKLLNHMMNKHGSFRGCTQPEQEEEEEEEVQYFSPNIKKIKPAMHGSGNYNLKIDGVDIKQIVKENKLHSTKERARGGGEGGETGDGKKTCYQRPKRPRLHSQIESQSQRFQSPLPTNFITTSYSP
ncbi:hypothetical protein PPL_03535 [Heterostelium album PN500]|uniref:Uncharacterized protein n=1 Tax=Heterostelium pallidum (strain ATCC 26659 / Pp 5 / PN500) TaxID=670386 RepID=D3B525_HETP5|nr:hypothetical protein PPL_03535 [Heterostelium album PN500]EFA83493.1 hypothetical protein PPL_03535 [Heterostelium album PN500]|eukprot:XP_020435610.1 hypothetical protein PPL_03535 [Heterostelium album PN500]